MKRMLVIAGIVGLAIGLFLGGIVMANTLRSIPCEVTIERGIAADAYSDAECNNRMTAFHFGTRQRGIEDSTGTFWVRNDGGETVEVDPAISGEIEGITAVFTPDWAALQVGEVVQFDFTIIYDTTTPEGVRNFQIDLNERVAP